MKYLKMFEHLGKSYWNISRGEYIDRTGQIYGNKNSDSNGFTPSQVAEVNKFAKSLGASPLISSQDKIRARLLPGEDMLILLAHQKTVCRVLMIEDEWFKVEFTHIKSDCDNDQDISPRYFKCDQFGGLLECLKDHQSYLAYNFT